MFRHTLFLPNSRIALPTTSVQNCFEVDGKKTVYPIGQADKELFDRFQKRLRDSTAFFQKLVTPTHIDQEIKAWEAFLTEYARSGFVITDPKELEVTEYSFAHMSLDWKYSVHAERAALFGISGVDLCINLLDTFKQQSCPDTHTVIDFSAPQFTLS